MYYLFLLPHELGIFTSPDKVLQAIRKKHVNPLSQILEWEEAVYLIRKNYSLECLFLMGIEDLSLPPKFDGFYSIPENCEESLIESEIDSQLVESIKPKQIWRNYYESI